MPHIIVEYTDNLKKDGKIKELLFSMNQLLLSFQPVFPIGGIRSRAIELENYCVAEGEHDDAFVHVTLKIGAGRDVETKKAVCEKLFHVLKEHFASLYTKRYLALSLELVEFQESGTYKHNNIHTRYKT